MPGKVYYMNYLPETEAEKLYQQARSAAENSYSPYSDFPVGAAVLTLDGQVFCGTNVENASFSLTICAERIALGYAVSQGHSEIRAIGVYSKTDSVAPCGACRQFIIEFGGDIVIIFRNEGEIIQKHIREVLPFAFTKSSLG